MAEVKIYRVVYAYDDSDASGINFSAWTQVGGMDEVLADLPAYLGHEVTVIGWEEKELDTEPESI